MGREKRKTSTSFPFKSQNLGSENLQEYQAGSRYDAGSCRKKGGSKIKTFLITNGERTILIGNEPVIFEAVL